MATTLKAAPKIARNGANPPRPAISTHLVLRSPQEARIIVQNHAYPYQRPLRPYHVQFLRQLIQCTCGGQDGPLPSAGWYRL